MTTLGSDALGLRTVIAAIGILTASTGSAQQDSAPEFQQVANDLFFYFDFGSSNSAVLITEEGVLVVDARSHPDDAERLLAEIRARTDAPIRYVINSQFHGDHHMGNVVFQREGATFIAHRDTQRIMEERFQFERETRPFLERGQDPNEVVLVLPDIVFDQRMTLKLGGRTVDVIYLGAGQNEGDTLVYFPHARALHTGGVFHNRSWANTSYTPSFDGWINVLESINTIDADVYLPPHGPLATVEDLDAFTRFISELSSGVRTAVDEGLSLQAMLDELMFEQYSDWRGYERRPRNLAAIYKLITDGEAQYLSPSGLATPVQPQP